MITVSITGERTSCVCQTTDGGGNSQFTVETGRFTLATAQGACGSFMMYYKGRWSYFKP
jgi:hypothetical protein